MKLEGTWSIVADRVCVWEVLTDANAVAECIPGCESMEPSGDDNDTYDATLSIGVGPVKGTYVGKVAMTDKVPPEQYKLIVKGESRVGFVKGEGLIKLAEDGECTVVTVDGDVQIGGTLASVGSRLIGVTAKMLMNKFFGAIEAKVKVA